MFDVRLRRGREIPMPGLQLGTLKRGVEPDLDNLVLRTEYALAHGDEPGMRGQFGKTADRLRMHFYIPATGPRPTVPPGRWMASQNAVIMSSGIPSMNSRENTRLRARIQSCCSA